MSQSNDVFVSVTRIPKVWNEGEDFRGDLVDWYEHVFTNANHAKELESTSLGSVDLEQIMYQLQSARRFRWFV